MAKKINKLDMAIPTTQENKENTTDTTAIVKAIAQQAGVPSDELETMDTEPKTLTRANKLTVKPLGDGFQADFYRTHIHIGSVDSGSLPLTSWCEHDINAKDTTKSVLREDFRKYVTTTADQFGILWQPEDLRTLQNKRKPVYKTIEDIQEDVQDMLLFDMDGDTGLMTNCPYCQHAKNIHYTCDNIIPMTKSPNGADLAKLGIMGGKYMNGNWAWADIECTVSIEWDTNDKDGNPITTWHTIPMQMVSGQLKKSKMTQTKWNEEIKKSLIEAGILTPDEPKESKKATKKAKESNPGTQEVQPGTPEADMGGDKWDMMLEAGN